MYSNVVCNFSSERRCRFRTGNIGPPNHVAPVHDHVIPQGLNPVAVIRYCITYNNANGFFPRIEADDGNLGHGGCSETLLWIVVMGSTVNLIAFGKRVLFAFLLFLLAFLSAAVTFLTRAARMIPPSRIPVRGSGAYRKWICSLIGKGDARNVFRS